MMPTDYEKFQQQVFDELEELAHAERGRIIADFVEIGHRAGIDVLTEILDNHKSVSEVFDAIKNGLPKK
jgi:hypothetical protein